MKRFLIGTLVVAWLAMSPPVYAGVADWPVLGQLTRVGACVVGATSGLVSALLTHLTSWSNTVISTVGHCALSTTDEVADVVGDVVAVRIPTPDPLVEEAPLEMIHE